MISALIEALFTVLAPPTVYFLIGGVLIGIFIGMIPGLGPTLGMAILLPLTIPFDGTNALLLLAGVYSGAMYGGSVAAILINVPGTSAAAATTLDGYPLSKQGKGLHALSISISASVLGGLISFSLLILLSPVLIVGVRQFGTPEYFLLAVLGLAMITVIAEGAIIKGIAAGAFGFALTTIGIAEVSTELRYTFGLIELYDGINYVAVLLGLFAVGEMLVLSRSKGTISRGDIDLSGNKFSGIKSVTRRPVLLTKSSLIGMIIGAIPGAGAAVSNFISWVEAKRSSKNPDKFGKGSEEGVIASESSNNATVGGSIVPTIAFGIPGSGATAVLLGGFLLHGLIPGPQMFTTDLGVTYSLFVGLLIGNFVILVAGYAIITKTSYITRVDTNLFIPIVVVVAVLGGLSLRANWVDPFTIAVMGILGYYMKQNNYSIIAFLLGVILGPIAEDNLDRSLAISGGSYDIFVSTPLRISMVAMIFILIFWPIIGQYRSR